MTPSDRRIPPGLERKSLRDDVREFHEREAQGAPFDPNPPREVAVCFQGIAGTGVAAFAAGLAFAFMSGPWWARLLYGCILAPIVHEAAPVVIHLVWIRRIRRLEMEGR